MAVVCPKPRRYGYGFSLDDHLRPLRHQASIGASQAESELLDIILTKENNNGERGGDLVAFGPPFLCGSPPSRAPNPVIQDEQFHREDVDRFHRQPMTPAKFGCSLAKFGHQPAIRVEGFDSRNCSVSALA